jgi:hypothetical protein
LVLDANLEIDERAFVDLTKMGEIPLKIDGRPSKKTTSLLSPKRDYSLTSLQSDATP